MSKSNIQLFSADVVWQIRSAYSAGYTKCLEEFGKVKPYLSLKQAFDLYGRGTVERWIDEGLVDVVKDGVKNSKCRINREQIELVANAGNRSSWFVHNFEK